jgi:hypothetical protein
MIYVGIDPGRTGGIAIIHPDTSVKIWPMPVSKERGINVLETLALWQSCDSEATIIAIEWNVARIENQSDHAFRFGLQTGQLDGIAQALGFEVMHVSPQAWMSKLGLRKKADDPNLMNRIAIVKEKYPAAEHLLYGPRGGILDGPLEALLIAHYVKLMKQTPLGKFSGPKPPRFMGLPPEDE